MSITVINKNSLNHYVIYYNSVLSWIKPNFEYFWPARKTKFGFTLDKVWSYNNYTKVGYN